MAALPITSSQSQTATQSPQSGTQAPAGGSQASSVQPGTTSGLLNGSGSIKLHPTLLPTVNLSQVRATTTSTQTTPPAKHHHVNGVFLAFALILFVIAAFLFWFANRQPKHGLS